MKSIVINSIIATLCLFLFTIIFSTVINLKQPKIVYQKNESLNRPSPAVSESDEILHRAEEMIGVKWTPVKDLKGWKNSFIFKAGQSYTGIPYSQTKNQVKSAQDFLDKLESQETVAASASVSSVYGNDCSGFVSAAWGISRQNTLSLYQAVKTGNEIDGNKIYIVSWDALQPGDALLREDGRGNGHVMLFAGRDSDDSEKLEVYDQNTQILPDYPVPSARKETRQEVKLKQEGYYPIRLERTSNP